MMGKMIDDEPSVISSQWKNDGLLASYKYNSDWKYNGCYHPHKFCKWFRWVNLK